MRTFIVTIVLLIGGPILAWQGFGGIAQGMSSKSWPTVEGKVRAMDVKEIRGRYGSRSYRPYVRYRYEVDGETYNSDQITNSTGTSSMEEAMMVARQYPIGEMVTVYYHPKTPDVAVLVTGAKGGNWFQLIFGVVLATVGGIGAFMAWRKLMNDDYHSSAI